MPSRAHGPSRRASPFASAALLAGAALATGCVPGGRPRDAGGGEAPDAAALELDAATGGDGGSAIDFEGDIVLDDDAMRALDPSALPTTTSPCRAPMLVRVDWASDGDTINIEDPASGAIERVRIIGVDTPEVAHEAGDVAECFGAEARTFTTALVDHYVWLTFEQACLDTYDRTLAHVHVAAAASGSWARQLLRRGLATVLVVSPNRAFESVLESDESVARAGSRGLWSACR